MKCDEARAAYLSGDSAGVDHIADCRSCTLAFAKLSATKDLLAEGTIWEEPSETLEDEVVTAVAGRPASLPPERSRLYLYIAAASIIVAVLTAAFILTANAPDWEVPLAGAGPAPGASAVTRGWNTDAGTRVVLDTDDLDRAPDGYVYELWFSGEGRHISAGTFLDPSQVELTVGVARKDFPRLWVTLEPLDADPGPSGITVLDTG